MKTNESLNSFIRIVENDYPQILPLITEKNEHFVHLELPCNPSKSFDEQTEFLKPVLEPSLSIPVKYSSVSFSEKQECFKIIVKLR